jgi:hypothetical protein
MLSIYPVEGRMKLAQALFVIVQRLVFNLYRARAVRIIIEVEHLGMFTIPMPPMCGVERELNRKSNAKPKQLSEAEKDAVNAEVAKSEQAKFVPTALQKTILAKLAGTAMRTDDLAAAVRVKDRSRLFKPGGVKELQSVGLVGHHERLGFYVVDQPPIELATEYGHDDAI